MMYLVAIKDVLHACYVPVGFFNLYIPKPLGASDVPIAATVRLVVSCNMNGEMNLCWSFQQFCGLPV